jgi:hypothetical protein
LDTSPDNVVKARRPADACKALGNISRSTLYRRIADRSLVAKKIGGVTLITEDSINALLANAPDVRAAA